MLLNYGFEIFATQIYIGLGEGPLEGITKFVRSCEEDSPSVQ